jgi:hypothetical protein
MSRLPHLFVPVPTAERQAMLDREIDALAARGYALTERRAEMAFAVLTHPSEGTQTIEVREDGRVGRVPRHLY